MHLTEQEKVRRESLQKIIELGIDPYPPEAFEVTATAAEIKANYKEEVLEDGTMPLSMLESKIDRWVDAQL